MRISDWSSDVCSSDLIAFDEAGREPDPQRMVRAYNQAAATLNLLRAFSKGGYANLHQVHAWTLDFMGRSPWAKKFGEMADHIDNALEFMADFGINQATRSAEHTSKIKSLMPTTH